MTTLDARPARDSHSQPLGHQHAGHRHVVQFYRDGQVPASDAAHHLGATLGAGGSAVIVATHRHIKQIIHCLQETGLNTDVLSNHGRLVVFDANTVLPSLMPDGQPDEARFREVIERPIARAAAAATSAEPRVAVYGELVMLLAGAGRHEAAVALERMWNRLLERQPVRLYCAYRIDSFAETKNGMAIGQICAEHDHVVPVEDYSQLESDEERLRSVVLLQQKAEAHATEIAGHRRTEAELTRRTEELEAALTARDAFLSVAAHELKTPITTLRVLAQLLLRDVARDKPIASDRLATALTAIEQQTGQLSSLISRLLDSDDLKGGRLRVAPTRMNLASLVRSAVESMQGCHCRFLLDSPRRLDAMVDPVRFEQVMSVLLNNAARYSPAESTVMVTLQDGDPIRLCVTDEGMGVAPADRERIFERGYRADGADHLSGLGLGLYIARQLVRLHGGDLHVEEPPHRGSRFVVTLPTLSDG